MREPLPAPPPGARKLDFCRRLGGDWRDLADLIDIPAYERARFPAGDEPRAVWDWLERRDRLPELPGLLDRIDRTDLGDRLRPWRHAEPSIPPPRRRAGRIGLAVAVTALLAVGVAAALKVMTRDGDRATAAPSHSAVATPTAGPSDSSPRPR
ncbi:hypothetical protein Val02_54720 [Virgisporangium aliadipatigenens]|uniref:Bacterial Death-like domain-containing protein n=1 Tax=Virgisporangium aliadipatigenens TaxID=741659 RepID=A0A8J3YNR9_9ACTN|nr:hypothetical protein [Virgisporangium aliadipatigenens]GIJ48586.1 hypothetical protein Val02_54720 [Virgisporangium aliadipatigenens]